jgi:hypothetical protein
VRFIVGLAREIKPFMCIDHDSPSSSWPLEISEKDMVNSNATHGTKSEFLHSFYVTFTYCVQDLAKGRCWLPSKHQGILSFEAPLHFQIRLSFVLMVSGKKNFNVTGHAD